MCGKLFSAGLICQMLIHSIFGCCWHHSHHPTAETVAQTEKAEEHTHPSITHKCRHHHKGCKRAGTPKALVTTETSAESGKSDSPLPAPCDEERCVYVVAVVQDSVLLSYDWLSANDILPFERVSLEPLFQSLSDIVPATAQPQATSLERCALLQTWLI